MKCILLLLAVLAAAPMSSDVTSDIVNASAERWSQIQNVTLDSNAYRDKQRFCVDLDEYFEDGKIDDKTAKKAAKALEKEARKEDSPGFVWRAHELRGRLLITADPKAAADAFQLAIDSYPNEKYAQPSKNSFFHHLVVKGAISRSESEGLDKTEDWLLGIVKSDERLHFFYGGDLEQYYADQGEEKRYAALLKKINEALAARLKAAVPKPTGDVREAGGDKRKLYQVLGADTKPLKKGLKRNLVLVMAGGSGQLADFQAWITRLATPQLDSYVFAILSAPTWSPEQAQEFVWVTNDVKKKYKAEFGVEEYADAVVEELRADPKLDLGDDTFLFAWSSGGPAAYKTILRNNSPYRGAYILSSVFKPNQLEVKYARGKRFFLEQGREDATTPFRFAEDAAARIGKRGGTAKLEAFEGGHGFAMPDPHASFDRALKWLSEPKGGKR